MFSASRLLCIEWALHGFRCSKLEGYYYFYSALAQSLAALLGVLGVFAVYRLQMQRDHILDIERQLRAIWSAIVACGASRGAGRCYGVVAALGAMLASGRLVRSAM